MKPILRIVPWFFVSVLLAAPQAAPNAREWNRLVAEYDQIQAMRAASPQPPETASRKEQIEILLTTHRRLEGFFAPFMQRLEEYYRRTGDARAASLYASEKIRIGDEYLRVLGRYDRALEMYRSALAIDAGNPHAAERIRLAEARRFVSMDQFAAVRQGMTEDQVRRLLGEPPEDWINQRVQNHRVYSVWIYPKRDGSASAVYFDGGVVYHTNWNAAPAEGH